MNVIRRQYSSANGVNEFVVLPGSATVGNSVQEQPDYAYYNAAGDLDGVIGEEKSEFLDSLFNPKVRAQNRAHRQKKQLMRLDIRKTKQESKADARRTDADAKKLAAESMKDQSGDIALANALSAPSSDPNARMGAPGGAEDTGLSMGAKIGIGLGIAAVVGVGVYFVIKSRK